MFSYDQLWNNSLDMRKWKVATEQLPRTRLVELVSVMNHVRISAGGAVLAHVQSFPKDTQIYTRDWRSFRLSLFSLPVYWFDICFFGFLSVCLLNFFGPVSAQINTFLEFHS
jgi:hypothetical protein